MSESPVYRPHDEAPAQAALRAVDASSPWAGLDARAFEIVSRGDFVSGRLCLPNSPSPRPAPLVLVVHAIGESAEAESIGITADWARRGYAVAAIDLPLHGRRASPKLSARLVQGMSTLSRGDALDADTRALVEEFARQSTSDLIRTLDALSSLPEVDGERVALVGVGGGSLLAALALAHDPRPLACAFAGGIGSLEDEAFDPAPYLARRSAPSPCPLLVMTSANDPDVPTAASEAFFETLEEPKRSAAIAGDSTSPRALTKDSSERITGFLIEQIPI